MPNETRGGANENERFINKDHSTIIMKGGIFFNHKKLKIICEDVLSTDKIPKNSVD